MALKKDSPVKSNSLLSSNTDGYCSVYDAAYLFGFNGMEKDDEVSGNGNSYTTLFRQYDPRLGRWKSVDPKTNLMPWQSPYNSMDGNPISKTDPKGDCPSCLIGAVVGAAVDYGFQVAENAYRDGGLSADAFTKNINLTFIAIAAGEGALTQGASAGKLFLVKTTAAVIQNTVDVRIDNNGDFSVKVETDAVNVAKNAFIDATVGEVTGAFVPTKKIKSELSKMGVNDGNVAKKVKEGLDAVDIDVTRNINNNVKKGSKYAVETANKTTEAVAGKLLNLPVDGTKNEVKKATDR